MWLPHPQQPQPVQSWQQPHPQQQPQQFAQLPGAAVAGSGTFGSFIGAHQPPQIGPNGWGSIGGGHAPKAAAGPPVAVAPVPKGGVNVQPVAAAAPKPPLPGRPSVVGGCGGGSCGSTCPAQARPSVAGSAAFLTPWQQQQAAQMAQLAISRQSSLHSAPPTPAAGAQGPQRAAMPSTPKRPSVATPPAPAMPPSPAAPPAPPSAKTVSASDIVEVLVEFKSSNEAPLVLRKRQRGVVQRLDDAGDALVDFADHPTLQWVSKANFGRIQRLEQAAGNGVDANVGTRPRDVNHDSTADANGGTDPNSTGASGEGDGVSDEEEEDDGSGSEGEGAATAAARSLWGKLGSWTSNAATRTRTWTSSLGAALVAGLENVSIEPAEYFTPVPKTDAHLNSVSIEYSPEMIAQATANFSKDRELGSGAFGCVYKGVMHDGTEVAIKLLKIPDEAGFEDEVQVLSRFRHPNLVILMGFARHCDTGARSLVYEYLSGGDVTGRLQKSREHKQDFDGKLRVSVALDAASGLSHMHNAQPRAFHRDIKCPNILLDRNGTAKMADFGLACVSKSTFQLVGQAAGTPGYACPEYLRTGVVTEGSEVHSFGMVILEMLTGIPPAVIRPNNPKELDYLVKRLLDPQAPDTAAQRKTFVERALANVDSTAKFDESLARSLADLVFRCAIAHWKERPQFVQIVEELRTLLNPPAAPPTQSAVATLPAGVPMTSGLLCGSTINKRPASKPEAPAPDCHLFCVASEGVDVHALPEQHRCFPFFACDRELCVGRVGQMANVWDSLVLEDKCRATISREHFKIIRQNGESDTTFYLQCLSPNGLVLNEEYVTPNSDRRQLLHNDRISLVAVGAAASPGSNTPIRRRFVTFRFQLSRLSCTERVTERSPPVKIGMPPDCSCQLRCIFSEGVNVESLDAQQRQIALPAVEASKPHELLVGRVAQGAGFWEALLPNEQTRGMVSREHFKVARRGASSSGTWHLVCLSPNGLAHNGDVINGCPAERQLRDGDIIALLAVADAPSAATRRTIVRFSVHFGNADEGNQTRRNTALVTPEDAEPISLPPQSLRPLPWRDLGSTGHEPDTSPAPRPGSGIEESSASTPGGTSSSTTSKSVRPLDISPQPSSPAKWLPDVDEDELGATPVSCEASSPQQAEPPAASTPRMAHQRSKGWSGAGAAGVLRVPVDVDLDPDD